MRPAGGLRFPGAAGLATAALLLVACDGCRDAAPGGAGADDAGDPGAAPRRPNVLVITMDTTRADRLGCYGNAQIRTPNIDRVAAQGALFEEAFSVQPVTLPAHCSIFTGRYPYNHGVRDNNIYRLSAENETLAELLSARGYLTTAFVSSYILNRQFGLDQGFTYYNDRFVMPKQKGRLPVDRRAAEVSFLARDWLDAVAGEISSRPFFLWLHYYDPHADYSPPHPYRTAYASPYDGEIAYMDDWIGYFFRELERRGLWEDTIVVLVADHGEGLGEYGEKTHGMFIYRPTTRVPLLIRYPGAVPAGARVPDRVSVVDIVPTILDLLGMDPPSGADGRSLVPLTRGEPGDADREIYSEVFIPRSFNWSDLSGVRAGDRFYISAPRPELYALEAGRNETGDLSSVEPQTLAAMAARLDRILATSSPSDVEQVAVNEEMVDQLEALGYFMGGGEPTAGSPVKKEELADPKDRIALFNLSQRVNSLSAAGMVDEAIDILRVMVREDPRNPRFLMELGGLLTEVGRHEEAIARLRDALALNPDDGRLHFMLGQCYEEWGRGDDAVLAYGVALETGGQHFLTLFHLGMIHIGEGRWDEAEAVFARARRLRPGDPGVLNNLGYIAIKGRGDHQGGIRLIEKALAAAPDDPRVLGSLGSALLGAGDSENAIRRLEEALRLVPDDREIMRLLEQAYTEAGSREGLEMLRGRRAAIESLGGPPSTPGSGRPRPK